MDLVSRIGIGLIGTGTIGWSGHFPGYAEIPREAKVVAICARNESVLSAQAEQSGAAPYTDYRGLLNDTDVDAVDICLPHSLHAKVALASLEAGKHVLVEKPLTLTLGEADRIIETAKGRGLKLMVAENMRFVRAYEVAKGLIDKGEIGKISYARAYAGGPNDQLMDPKDWRGKLDLAGGGTMIDDGIHCFYLLRWLVGDVNRIFASTNKFVRESPREVEDNAVGTIWFSNGAMGVFSFSNTTASPWTEQVELFGTEGSIHLDMSLNQPLRFFSNKRSLKVAQGESSPDGIVCWQEPMVEHSVQDWVNAAVKREVKHFVDCIREGTEPLVSGEDGKKALELVLKAYESARLGRAVAV